jgi:hypothetical protein
MNHSESVPKALQEKYDEIIAITDPFCHEHLNDEYAQMSRYLAAALARKRPSPLERGRIKSWACGIVYAIGTVNFLSDKSFEPSMKMEDLCRLMGVSPSTGGNKAGEIRKMFDMHQFDPNWTVPSMMDENPMIWFVSVDGIIVDIRREPREIQEIAYQQGIIPYIHADRHQQS